MNSTDILKYGHQTVMETIEDLPPIDWQTSGVCGMWSVKDIVAHLASYELVLVDVLNSLLNNDSTSTLARFLSDFEGFNDIAVEWRRETAAEEILSEYEKAHEKTLELLAQIPLAQRRQPGLLPWYGDDYDLEDLIVYMYYGHKREHSAQIAVFRDQLMK